MKRLSIVTVATVLALVMGGCASAPANLSPQGVQDFNKTRVIKTLDVIRDTATDANALTPPLISTPTTRKIVTFHRSALVLINAGPVWKLQVEQALTETLKDLPPAESKLLAPYAALAKVVIDEVGQ